MSYSGCPVDPIPGISDGKSAKDLTYDPYLAPIYLRGGFNSWGTPGRQLLVQVGPTELSLATSLPAGAQEFKLGDPGWGAATNFGAAAGDGMVTLGQAKPLAAAGDNLSLNVPGAGVYCFDVSVADPAHPTLTVRYLRPYTDGIDLLQARARWLDAGTLVVKALTPGLTYALYHDPDGHVVAAGSTLQGGQTIPLQVTGTMSISDPAVARDYPYLDGYTKLAPVQAVADMAGLLREQLVLAGRSADGMLRAATSVQTAGVIDQLLAYGGSDLGVSFSGGAPVLKLWAPTARGVQVVVYDDAATTTETARLPLQRGEQGVFSVMLPADYRGKYYLYEVEVYSRDRGVHKNLTTDPYSVSLAADSRRSQLIDLSDAALKPAGWDALVKPPLASFADISLYELHLREFSMSDESVPAERRGR